MSTILEALRERDRTLPGAGEPIEWRDGRGSRRRRWLGAAVLGLAAAGAGVALLGGTVPAPQPPRAEPAPRAPASVAVAQPRKPATPVAPAAIDEPPRARVGRWKPAAPSTPALPEVGAGAEPPSAAVAAAASSGEPWTEMVLRLESIRYATAPAERTATLRIDGAPPVTLRQGESASGLEVQLILPKAVYVRLGADVFALGDPR
jgi:hypothetical protein